MKFRNFFMVATVFLFAVTGCKQESTVTGIAISPESATLTEVGATTTLTAALAPSGTKADITWTSSNPEVATIVGDGLTATVTAVGNGTATITAAADIFTASSTITVNIGGSTSGDGEGTETSPYTVAGAIKNQGKYGWVEGYIVGYAWAGDNTGYYFSTDTCTQATNILIADSKSETTGSNTMPIQLPAGAVRNGLNLKDVKANLSKKVKLYGSLAAYFGQPGLKSTSYYELEGGTTGGTKPIDVTGALLNETLLTQTSFDKFTKYSVAGDQEWTFSTSSYGAMISGYSNGASYANEDWFISPALDLSGKTNIKLSFEHARGPAASINVGVAEGYYTVWISNNYNSGAPSTATWTQITGVVHGTVGWGFVSSGQLAIPTANLAANARFAFKYLSIDGASATWEIKNVIVK